tara:strand:- start:847 stop:1164 length:318 start_codon:yes stop_codon:yes gene_type:complete
MNARIYFATEPNFGIGEPRVFPDEYRLVASVEAANLGEVFTLCNTVDAPWWENRECELLGECAEAGGARSMAVGDVVVMPDGKVQRAEMLGWTELGTVDELGFGL